MNEMHRAADVARVGGFPAEYFKRVRRERIRLIGSLVAVGLGALLLIWGAVFWNWPMGWAALAGAVALWFTAVVSSELWDLASTHLVRIVPYFEHSVPGVDTFFRSGYALARNCAYLDEIALHAGMIPLSVIGFADDYGGKRIPWYDPDEGLRTIVPLLETLQEHPNLVPEPEAVIADLERMRNKLEGAHRLAIRFCLHLRMDSSYTAMEFERRRGKY